MKTEGAEKEEGLGPVRCAMCLHFAYFSNVKGHNSPHALGKCNGEPWDGNRGQWAMFQHPCKSFVTAEGQGPKEGGSGP